MAAADLGPAFGEELIQSLDQEDAEGAVGGGLTLLTVEDIKSETLNQTEEPFEVCPGQTDALVRGGRLDGLLDQVLEQLLLLPLIGAAEANPLADVSRFL